MANIDRPRSRAMMAEVEKALRPIIEQHKDAVDPKVWEDYEEGLLTGDEVVHHIFFNLNPYPPNGVWDEKDHPND